MADECVPVALLSKLPTPTHCLIWMQVMHGSVGLGPRPIWRLLGLFVVGEFIFLFVQGDKYVAIVGIILYHFVCLKYFKETLFL